MTTDMIMLGIIAVPAALFILSHMMVSFAGRSIKNKAKSIVKSIKDI